METYTKEDLQTDIGWLHSHQINKKEAEDFIMNLLNSKMVKSK